jgi:hypothetical protein
MHTALPGQGSGGQQQRRRWNRQSSLLDQDPREEQSVTVMNYEFEHLGHSVGKQQKRSDTDLLDAGKPERFRAALSQNMKNFEGAQHQTGLQ